VRFASKGATPWAPAISIVYRRVQHVRRCLRLLLERVFARVRRQDDGGVHSPRHGLRCDLSNGGRLHGAGMQGTSVTCVRTYARHAARSVRGIRSPTAKLVRRRADAVPRSVGESPVHLKSTIKPPEQGRPMVCRREPGSRFVSNGDYVKNA